MVRLHHLKISVVAVALAACAHSASAQKAKVPAKALADDTR